MDKKRSVRKGGESHNFMEKLLMRFKMTKHATEDKSGGKLTPTLSTEQKPSLTWEKPKISAENLMEFSDQLEQLLGYIQELKEISYFAYDYPSSLNDKLDKEALELRNLFREVRAAAIDVDRLRRQRHAVKKEKTKVTKKLQKLREEEIKELESVIHAYAKPLYSKWETIRNTQKTEILENFMSEVTGKHRAMEILQELITRKLSKLEKKHTTPFLLMKNLSSTTFNNKIRSQLEQNVASAANWNITPLQEASKASTVAERTQRTATDRDVLRVNRRKRQRELRDERKRQTETNSSQNNRTCNNNNGNSNNGLELQLVPINTDEAEGIVTARQTSGVARTPPATTGENSSDEDSVSMSSNDFIIDNIVHQGTPTAQPGLQAEMRNVLHALFGEIRQIPQLGFNGRNRHNNSGNDIRSSRTSSH